LDFLGSKKDIKTHNYEVMFDPDYVLNANYNRNQLMKSFVVGLCRVARWFIFEPNIPIWVILGGPSNG
jgi:hypothetical protein